MKWNCGDIVWSDLYRNRKDYFQYISVALNQETVFDHEGAVWEPINRGTFGDVVYCANCNRVNKKQIERIKGK